MSSAYYPLGMNSMPASGYNHRSTYFNKQYIPWKGTGANSFPVGVASGHIRPLTNNDPGNVFRSGSFASRVDTINGRPARVFIPRPIKHFRKGRVIPALVTGVPNLIGKDPYNQSITIDINENALINYNTNRFVKSSKGTSLGGGFGGSGLLNDMQDKPGAFVVKQNPLNEKNGITQLDENCRVCEGVGIVASYKPNITFLEENPEPNTQNKVLCCNDERKAKRRAIYASTNLKPNYYTTTKQYLQNRCKTYDQKAFNFLSYRSNTPGPYGNNNPYYITSSTGQIVINGKTVPVKPGGPLSLTNTYLANCQPNAQIYNATENALIAQMLSIMLNANMLTQPQVNQFNTLGINTILGFFNWVNGLQNPAALKVFTDFIRNPYWGMPLAGPSNQTGCQLVVYKPNNYQYAKQGAVDSSTRTLKLDVNTISTNAASIQNYNNTGAKLVSANELYRGNNPNVANLLKNKVPNCNTPWPLNFSQSGRFQNKKYCNYKNQLPIYQVPASQPSPYRYYPGTVFSSNHFSQSPNTYNTTSGSAPSGNAIR
jgi:hypothetical protein